MKITEIPFLVIPIEDDGYHILTHGIINGMAASFLIDTGASRCVFDEHNIRKFLTEEQFAENEKLSTGLGTNTMPTKVVNIEQIRFGSLHINNYDAVAIDLSHIGESYAQLGLPQIDGVLGSDLLNEYKCVINYKKRKLKFYF